MIGAHEESIFSFQARAERHINDRLAAKDRELDRARRALRLEAAKLAEERRRGRAAISRLAEIRESFRGKGASQAHYIAILALHRVQEELGYR